ncbi:hypothetical protein [Megasphaera sp.]|uniref:hypothetical protein n=1 Tax=Megasphaera sp. TaxID=2023260 RepID=UPI003F7CFC27
MSTVKAFISQPMRDKTDEQILAERTRAIKAIKKQYGEDVVVLDSFFQGAPHDAKPLWFLGQSILILSQADVTYFIGDWKKYRGCKAENMLAHEYGIKTIEE